MRQMRGLARIIFSCGVPGVQPDLERRGFTPKQVSAETSGISLGLGNGGSVLDRADEKALAIVPLLLLLPPLLVRLVPVGGTGWLGRLS